MTGTTRFLRRFIGMRIVEVRDNAAGIVLEVGPPGRMSRRRVLLKGVTDVTELRTPPDADVDDLAQAEIDIGDDIYEQRRYLEENL